MMITCMVKRNSVPQTFGKLTVKTSRRFLELVERVDQFLLVKKLKLLPMILLQILYNQSN